MLYFCPVEINDQGKYPVFRSPDVGGSLITTVWHYGCDMADKYTDELGSLYEVTTRQRQMAANAETYYRR